MVQLSAISKQNLSHLLICGGDCGKVAAVAPPGEKGRDVTSHRCHGDVTCSVTWCDVTSISSGRHGFGCHRVGTRDGSMSKRF